MESLNYHVQDERHDADKSIYRYAKVQRYYLLLDRHTYAAVGLPKADESNADEMLSNKKTA